MSHDNPAIPTAVPALSDDDATVELDLRGLRCPLPVLRTRKALMQLAPGQRLRVACSDPLAGLDIPHLARETGDRLLDQVHVGHVQIFTIRKA